MPDALKVYDAGTGFMKRAGMLDEKTQEEVKKLESPSSRFWIWLLLPKLETAVAVDVPSTNEEDGSGVAAFRYGRVGRIFTWIVTGSKNPYQEELGKPRVWRFGTTAAVQWDENYDVKPSNEPSPFENVKDYILAARIYPERIENRMRLNIAPSADMIYLPWPLTEVTVFVKGGEKDGYTLDASSKYRPNELRPMPASNIEAGPKPSLANRFITGDTVLAMGWLAPAGAEVPDMMTEFAPIDDGTFSDAYRVGIASIMSKMKDLAGPRAALLLYRQPDVRMKPGYAGIFYVQELKSPERFGGMLPSLLGSLSRGVYGPDDIAPASYPYFVKKPADAGLPEYYLYHSSMVRVNEGYQPLICVHNGMLIYASSPGTLSMALSAKEFSSDPVYCSVSYRNTDELGWKQLEHVYRYLVAENLASRTGADVFNSDTDLVKYYQDAVSLLVQFKSIDLSTTGDGHGAYNAVMHLLPEYK